MSALFIPLSRLDPGIAIDNLDVLTPREADAVLWVASGKTSWEAGMILGVTEGTLDVHVANAARKLEAVNRPHLVAKAFLRGILVPLVHNGVIVLLIIVAAFGHSDPARAARRSARSSRSREEQSADDHRMRAAGGG